MDKQSVQAFYDQKYLGYHREQPENFDYYKRNQVLKRIYHDGQSQRILDLGAGRGTVSQFFLQKNYEVYAIEWTQAGVERLNQAGIKAFQHDIEAFPYPFEDNYFDEIFWGDNIEHLFFPERTLNEIHRILKPGGRLVLSTPNHGWIINRLYYLIMGVPRRTEGGNTPIWEWQHIRYFNRSIICQLLDRCGFSKNFRFHGAEQRQPFGVLSRFFPALFGSVMVVESHK
ncbi:class I SAM-dependent methyltransferase [Cyanobacteria bacterium FACHB-63]|nr:class I SAM-dependent methyltransferase [Cyanobacteria bacterium FACHB-63]